MGHHRTKKGALLIGLALAILSIWAPASGEEVRVQGLIMNIDFKQNTMVVNEKTFTWSKATAIHDDRASFITIERFKLMAWVYIVGERTEENRTHIKKIYLLPRRVENKEKHLYPFME